MLSPSATPVLRRRLIMASWTALAVLPVLYIATQIASGSRNFPFWDEVDSAIDFVLQLSTAHTWADLWHPFVAVGNEHRTVTSRIIFALSYWLTGTLNFHVIGLIGNLFIVAACGFLIAAARGAEQRIRLGVVLALMIFQLEHFENFIWSGASIDHFQVVMFAVGAIVMITRGTTGGLVAGAAFAVLGTFTLAHGCVIWPLGAWWFMQRREWRRLAGWCGVAMLALVGFFWGFEFNPGHHIPGLANLTPLAVGRFWLQLIGAPLALGHAEFAAWPGAALLIALGILGVRGTLIRHPVALLTALFGLVSLVLVAFGRVHVETPIMTSRYMILSALAWISLIWVLLEESATPERPFRWLVWLTPALIGFNITADVVFQPAKEAFIEVRDRAVTRFKQYAEDGRGITRLHPIPGRADQVLAAAKAKGIYRLPHVSDPVVFPLAEPSNRIVTYVDELITTPRAVTIGGWAMIPGKVSQRGHVYLVLQSEDSFLVYSTLTLQRPDVARAYKEPRWRLCGFRAVIGRERLPTQNFKIGVMITEGGDAEYLITDRKLQLVPEADAREQLASGQ